MAPFGLFGLYLCYLMPRSDEMMNTLVEEEEQRIHSKEIEMVPMKFGEPVNGISIGGSELVDGEKEKSKSNF